MSEQDVEGRCEGRLNQEVKQEEDFRYLDDGNEHVDEVTCGLEVSEEVKNLQPHKKSGEGLNDVEVVEILSNIENV